MRLDLDTLRACAGTPLYFGLGFVQLKIDADRRLHFWHPACTEKVSDEEIHDHRYSFESRILHGSMTHETWTFHQHPEGEWEMVEVSCSPGNPADSTTITRGVAERVSRETLTAGSVYRLPLGTFHRVEATKLVTMLRRGPVMQDHARVIRPVGRASICAFSMAKSESECWQIVEELIGEMNHHA
jgi:hypothetical protein